MDADKAKRDAVFKEKQRYVKGYLQVIQNLYKRGSFSKEQSRLADQAFARRLPPSAFVTMLRSKDPAYPRTQDYQKRRSEAQDVWSKLRPGRPMPHDYSQKYVASNLNKMQLIEKSERAAAARGRVPKRAQPNPSAYRQLRDRLNNSYRNVNGDQPNPLLHKMIFSARMKQEQINEQFADLFGGKEMFAFMKGVSPQNDQMVRESVMKAFPQQKVSSASSVFIDKQQNQFDIGVDDLSAPLISSEL